MKNVPIPTFAQFEGDLENTLSCFAGMLNKLFHPKAKEMLLSSSRLPPGIEIDLSLLGAGRDAKMIYDFAVHARIPSNAPPFLDVLEAPTMLVVMLQPQSDLLPISIDYIVSLAFARWALSDENKGHSLTFENLAILANIDVASVRQAMESTKSPLKTFDDDGEIYVAKDDALDWLKTQPGFKPTVVYDAI